MRRGNHPNAQRRFYNRIHGGVIGVGIGTINLRINLRIDHLRPNSGSPFERQAEATSIASDLTGY